MKKLLRTFLVLVLFYTNLQDGMANEAGEGIGKLHPRLYGVSNLFATPDAPTNLVVTPLNTGGMIQFTVPLNDGGSTITNYEYSTDNGSTWVTPSPAITTSPFIISSGLTNCTSYQIKIRAVNTSGSGAASVAATLLPSTSTDFGVNWSSRVSAADISWSSVTYGNGLFVAVANSGTGNRVMTSRDGITWTSRISAVDNGWTSVMYGNGLFVAVSNDGTGNQVMTSTDGITWTSRTSPADNIWRDVAYGNGLFVAVAQSGTGNRVMTSSDGITWTSRTSSMDNEWVSVTYGNGLFVAVAQTGTGNRVMTSPDGINWTAQISAADNDWTGVTYGNGLFVAVAQTGNGNRVMTSPDGITWTSRTSASDNNWYSIEYGNGLFIAVSYTGSNNRVMTSPDGIAWTTRTSASNEAWNSITYGNGFFVVVSSTGTGNRVMTSGYEVVANALVISAINPRNGGAQVVFSNTASIYAPTISNYQYSTDDGSNWTAVSPFSFQSPLIITGLTNATSYSFRIRSINSVGTSCASSSVSVTPSLGTVSDAPTNLVVNPINTGGMIQFTAPVSDGGSSITNYEYSTDGGSTWTTPSPAVTSSPLIISSGLTNCTSYQMKLRAVNASGIGAPSVAATLVPSTSIDIGINWVQRVSAADNEWRSVTYGNGLFVAVSSTGTGNRVMTSPDGINWTSRTSAADNFWTSVTYGNGLFVAVAQNGTGNRVMTSPDGITWTARTSASDNIWNSVTYGNGLFVAVAGSGTNLVLTSPDGINWTSRSAAANNQWNSVTYGNGLFVAVSQSGVGSRVMTSPDGTAWTSQSTSIANTWMSVTYGNGKFVAVSISPINNQIMTSPDAINWTAISSPENYLWRSVTYNNGLFVAVASGRGNGNRVMTSPDGITWTTRTSAADNQWYSVTYGNGLFVAVAMTGIGNRVMTSNLSTVADAPVITAAPVSQSEATVSFTQTTSAYTPAITNYQYSIDNGTTWTTLSPASTTSPITVSGITDFTNQIQLQAINSIGNSCPATFTVVGLNLNKYGQKTSSGSEFINQYGALGISGIRATGESRTYSPVISATAAVTDLTLITATSGGTVGADGGASVTARGVCWSRTPNPTTANSKTTDGTGTGTFTSAITGLVSNTTYYVRSYATNSVGTAYGPEVSFTTVATIL